MANIKTNKEQLREIVLVRQSLKDAQAISCSCSGFVLQYQGCSCEKKRKVLRAKEKFWESVNNAVVREDG